MKGLVFTELLEMVEERFSIATCDRMIEEADVPSAGAYTSVGTYDPAEMVRLLAALTTLTHVSQADLLRDFGGHLFRRFVVSFPQFFEKVEGAFAFLPRVDDHVHVEVRKLYPDAELPSFACERTTADRLAMTYRSTRELPDLAEGLILACIEHFHEPITLRREAVDREPKAVRFVLERERPSP